MRKGVPYQCGDCSALPSNAVVSVNGKSGAVKLEAADIPSAGNSNVQEDINTAKNAAIDCSTAIADERTARQTADSALQADIDSAAAAIGAKLHSINGVKGDGAGNVEIVSGDNIEINPVGDNLGIRVTDDVSINNLNVAGDIIQQGAAYETHAEKVYTANDYIYMRDGAVGGLAAGSLSGFEVIKYDGSKNGRLAIDSDGVARVGDAGDEQPLLTREESADLSNGEILTWDALSSKAVGVPIDARPTDGSSNPISSDGVYDSRFTQVLYKSGLTINNGQPATISELTQLDDDCIIFFCFKNDSTGLEQWFCA
ncbi:MAG: hypothetical protein WCS18_10805, partial [Sphaerochaetaceae bacterium]